MPSRFVCPEKNIRGAWMSARCQRARSDAPSGRTELNLPSLANLLYQRPVIQQTKGESKNQKSINKSHHWTANFNVSTVFSFDALSTLSKPLRQYSYRGLSVKTVWASSASFFTAWWLYCFNGYPCVIYRGAAVVAAFSGYSFGLLQKSNSPARRDSQTLKVRQ